MSLNNPSSPPLSPSASTIQPEVDGMVSRIFVKPGDRVRLGTPIVQINADKQQAAVRSTEANRAGTEADVEYWRQQVKRLESLVAAGAISRQEFEQAQNSLRTAEARTAALQAQVREGQGRAAVLPRQFAPGGRCRRHHDPSGRPRDERHGHHHDRRQLRARGGDPGAARSLARSASRASRSSSSMPRARWR